MTIDLAQIDLICFFLFFLFFFLWVLHDLIDIPIQCLYPLEINHGKWLNENPQNINGGFFRWENQEKDPIVQQTMFDYCRGYQNIIDDCWANVTEGASSSTFPSPIIIGFWRNYTDCTTTTIESLEWWFLYRGIKYGIMTQCSRASRLVKCWSWIVIYLLYSIYIYSI